MTKKKSVRVGDVLLSKGGNRYLKFKANPNRDNPFPIVINEGDILFMDMITDEFRATKNIPDFVRGYINAPVKDDDDGTPKF